MSEFKFDRQVFLGARPHSDTEINAVHERVDYAMMVLSGLQQPNPCTSEIPPEHDRAERDEDEQELFKATRDIVRALTGKEIDFK